MGRTQVPYHPDADLTTDSIIRRSACVTRLNQLRQAADVARDYQQIESSGNQATGECPKSPLACVVHVSHRVANALRRIKRGERASTEYVQTINAIEELVRTHRHELMSPDSIFYEACGRQFEAALREAIVLRNRIAHD